MRDEEIDRIRGGEEDIVPSARFHASVMAAVHREAATPPPIPFPWGRALPAFAASALALAGSAVLLRDVEFDAVLPAAARVGAPWIALAVLTTAGSLLLSRRLADERF